MSESKRKTFTGTQKAGGLILFLVSLLTSVLEVSLLVECPLERGNIIIVSTNNNGHIKIGSASGKASKIFIHCIRHLQ